jgi:hypothetical protein
MAWVKRLFALLAVSCLLYFGWRARDLLGGIITSASLTILVAAVGMWLLMHLLSPLFATVVYRGSGHAIAYQSALRIHLANLPARYIPGGIWHTVGRIVAFRGLGIDANRISLFVLLENVLAAAVAFLLGGGLLFLYRGSDDWGSLAVLCAAAGGLVLVALPVLLHFWMSGRSVEMPARYYIGSIFVVLLTWCVGSAAFVLFVSSFTALSLEMPLLETAAVYLFSWGVGFLAVFAPQGIGVFEVTAGELLRGSFALGGVAVLLAGFRAVIFIADLLAWMLGRLLLPRDSG